MRGRFSNVRSRDYGFVPLQSTPVQCSSEISPHEAKKQLGNDKANHQSN
jgi:hypothetical protein